MERLLIHPPFADPTQPYLSLPALKGYLRARRLDARVVDLNLEAACWLFEPEQLEELGRRIGHRFLELNRAQALEFEEQREYRRLFEARPKIEAVIGADVSPVEVFRRRELFFDPAAYSLARRQVEFLFDALSAQQWMRDKTGIDRIPKSTLSDALKRFDPQALRPLIKELAGRVPALGRRDADLELITKQVLAADGTHFSLAGEVAWALQKQKRNGHSDKAHAQVRWNLQFNIQTFTPVDGDISGADDASEPDAFIRKLKSDTIYVVDRNFIHYRFLNAVIEHGSNFVVRSKKNNVFEAQESHPLTARDHELGILRDETGVIPGPRSKGNEDCRSFTARPPAQTLRRVTVWDDRNHCEMVLLTDLLDVPAFAIATLYRKRWQIELFFKWLKCFASFDHLLCNLPESMHPELLIGGHEVRSEEFG